MAVGRFRWLIALATIVVALAVAAPAGAAGWWIGNVFQSPTGNLVCHYNSYNQLACGRLNDGRTWAITTWGQAFPRPRGLVYRWTPNHVLEYGETWTAPPRARQPLLKVRSSYNGLRVTTRFGHGFFLNRVTYHAW